MKPLSFMMTTTILGATAASVPDDYCLESRCLLAGRVAEVYSPAGELAASGRVFLVGETAVFDRIETDLAHRRRGLGRTIMSELARLAFQDGASRGALVATPDGRALYSAMGWQLHSLYTTAVRE
jgi:GNAT superfamily N-acetyltransferase